MWRRSEGAVMILGAGKRKSDKDIEGEVQRGVMESDKGGRGGGGREGE